MRDFRWQRFSDAVVAELHRHEVETENFRFEVPKGEFHLESLQKLEGPDDRFWKMKSSWHLEIKRPC